jgi:hypothetical protein|nr:MAG TPA: CMP/hydroxymethyl CMP hydrolase [Caudoviricetes sp.]
MATEKKEEEKTCFVIMPFSDVEGYDKGHFTRVYEYLIKPACEKAGFVPIRADENSKSDVIIVDILQKILECDMAICDMSSKNPNVFYELGFRQAFNKKTVLIKDSRTDMPFDTSAIRTITYNDNLRIDEVKASIPKIAESLSSTFSSSDDSGYSLLKLLSIQKPATIPEGHKLSEDSSMILDSINELRQQIIQINKRNIPEPTITSSQNDSPIYINGEPFSIGDQVFITSPDQIHKQYIGTLYKETNKSYHIKNGSFIKVISKDSKEAKMMTSIPF